MKEVKYVRISVGTALRRWLGGAALALVSLTVSAQGVSSSAAFDRFYSEVTGGGKTTVGFGSNGTPLVSPGVPSAAPDGGPTFKASNTGSFTNPAGNRVPVTGSGRVPMGNIVGALGRFLGKLSFPLTMGMAAYDFGKEMGWFMGEQNPDGSIKWQKNDPNSCTVAPCSYYYLMVYGVKYEAYDRQTVANQDMDQRRAHNPGFTFEQTGLTTTDGSGYGKVSYRYHSSTTTTWTNAEDWFGAESAPTTGAMYIPSTQQEFLDAVAAKSGWPTSSNIARAAVQAAEANGEKLPITPVTVTGPATSTGPQTTKTSTNPDGSTKSEVTNITYNHTYEGDTITTTITTTTNITNNGSAGVNTTQTQQEDKTDPPKEDPCAKSEAIGCAKMGTPPTDAIPKSTRNVTYAEDNIGLGGGACPADVDLGPGRVLKFTPICDKLVLARPMVIAMATFSALLIVLGVRSEES